MKKFIVEINVNDKGVACGKFTEGLDFKGNEAYGDTLEECLKDLVFRMEQESLRTEEDRFKHFLKTKRIFAVKLVNSMLEVVGNEWFDLKMLSNRTEEPKESLIIKLDFLEQFGFIEVDRPSGPGKRYRIAVTQEEREMIISDKIKELNKTIEGLNFMREVPTQTVVVGEKKFLGIKYHPEKIKTFFKNIVNSFKSPK
jgi:hypothetical protein